MEVQEILIIKNGAENYGISTENINQISRVPILMPLPLRPVGVRGLCAVAGNIVSLVDLNILLGMPEVDYDASATRLLSLNDSCASNALLVSEVYNTVEVEQSNIEYVDQEDDPVIAIYKYEQILVQIISLEKLIAKIDTVHIDAKEVKNGKIKQESEKEIESHRFLIFSMHREKFALNIDFLQEIILADRDITEIAGSAEEVVGLITLRDELLMVIDLRKYYNFQTMESDKNRILLASYKGKKVGLLIDEIIDIKNFPVTSIEYMNDTFEKTKIAGVIHDENSLISFFDENVLEQIFHENDTFIDNETQTRITIQDDIAKEVIVFKLHGREYAFDVESVDEIIDIVNTTDVAFSNKEIDGIINIRGQVVTMVSLFKKLGYEPCYSEEFKIIVCNINNVRIGFTVESVSDIIGVKESEIHEEDGEIFTNVLHLEDGERLVLGMDVNTLVEEKEI